MTLGPHLEGVALLVALLAPLAAFAWSLRARLLPDWWGAPARLAEAVFGLAALVLIAEALGSVGAFATGPLIGACALAAVVFLLALRRHAQASGTPAPEEDEIPSAGAPGPPAGPDRLALGVAITAVAVVVAQWIARTATGLDRGMLNVDTLGYHGPFAVRFAQDGWIAGPHFTASEPGAAYFPATTELLHAVGVLLLGSDFLTPLMNLGWLGLALLAGWCAGRPFGAAPATLTGTALLLACPLLLHDQAGDAKNDVALLALLMAPVALLLADGRREGAWRPAALLPAALAAGLALGVKLPALPAVGALTLTVLLAGPRASRLGAARIWLPALALCGGYWYARNVVVVGNPLPWVEGIGPLSLPSVELPIWDRIQQPIVDYGLDGGVWRDAFLPGLEQKLGPVWPAVLALPLAGLAASCLRGGPRLRAFGLAGFASLAAYLFTPGSAGPQGLFFAADLRYIAPPLAFGLLLVPLLPELASRTRQRLLVAAAALLLGIVQLAPQSWTAGEHAWTAALAGIAAAVVGAAVALMRRRGAATPILAARAAGATAAAALVLLAAGPGWGEHRDYLAARYADPRFLPASLFPAYAWARELHRERIAVAGSYLQYPLYGNDLTNHVQYVGRRTEHGGFTPIRDCRGWRAALARGRYRFVVITPFGEPFLTTGTAPEREWTASDPAATPVIATDRLSVFRLDSPLDPAAC